MSEQICYLLFLVAISIVNSIGQIMMRWGGLHSVRTTGCPGPRHPWQSVSTWWLVGIGLTWVCGLGWAWCLRRLPLGTAIPLYTGLVYVLSVLGGVCLLRERMSLAQLAGIAAILAGLVLVTLSAGTAGASMPRS